ncbi:MAG: recombinase family protein [Pseudomonadota bacterium]|nr:recombinase family protein [Pseudomonadota bacterium]
MKIGYARVSTDTQNLDPQRHALNVAGCDVVYEDLGISGAVQARQGLTDALGQVGQGDTLIVWKLDRLGRSLADLIHLIDGIGKAGGGFVSLTEAIDTTSAGGRLLFHMMGALAEFERALIAERTVIGMEAARRRGTHVGRPRKLTAAQIDHAREMIGAGKPVAHMAELYGVDPSTLWRALRGG